ncbi:GTPase IMAP family member GIMD1-like [Odontesthes bonariensis]|uniref:GTPase IMAP family member GIMD1-like n=1 Tax=Odontesthes bonariensis TaxID=219752 RepID=UPI003F58596F
MERHHRVKVMEKDNGGTHLDQGKGGSSPTTTWWQSLCSQGVVQPQPKEVEQMDRRDKHRIHGNTPLHILSNKSDEQNALVLNVLLLGDGQSGRSSVGNALIGAHDFRTGRGAPGVPTETECRLLGRNFPKYFRRQGAESDLGLRVIDTPPERPHAQSVHKLCPEGVHVLVIVVRADLLRENTHLQQHTESLFGPVWYNHALLVITHADHLTEAELNPTVYLSRTADWLRALAEKVSGGVCFLDNSCDWPSTRGRPLRDRLLNLSAKNHHQALRVRTGVEL